MDGPAGGKARAGRPADLRQIVEIYNHYVMHSSATFEVVPVTVEDRLEWLELHTRGERHRLVVATDAGDRVVGWATTSPFRPRAAYETTVESSVYCRSGFEGRGVGSALYRSLFDSIQGEDIERVVAGVCLPNASSVALHQRFEFRAVGVFSSVGRKFGRYWDVAWYERPRALPASWSGSSRGRPL